MIIILNTSIRKQHYPNLPCSTKWYPIRPMRHYWQIPNGLPLSFNIILTLHLLTCHFFHGIPINLYGSEIFAFGHQLISSRINIINIIKIINIINIYMRTRWEESCWKWRYRGLNGKGCRDLRAQKDLYWRCWIFYTIYSLVVFEGLIVLVCLLDSSSKAVRNHRRLSSSIYRPLKNLYFLCNSYEKATYASN